MNIFRSLFAITNGNWFGARPESSDHIKSRSVSSSVSLFAKFLILQLFLTIWRSFFWDLNSCVKLENCVRRIWKSKILTFYLKNRILTKCRCLDSVTVLPNCILIPENLKAMHFWNAFCLFSCLRQFSKYSLFLEYALNLERCRSRGGT